MNVARFLIPVLLVLAVSACADDGKNARVEAEENDRAERVDQATDRAVAFLARIQRADGSWGTTSRGPYGANAAICSMAVMAFLAKGHTPGDGPYGENVTRGIEFILSCQKPNGLIVARPSKGPMYSHCISMLMLAEAVGMLKGPLLTRARRALAKAVKLSLEAQAIPKSTRYAGGFGYSSPSSPSPARSGTGILCLEICGEHMSPQAERAGDYLLKQRLRYPMSHFYYSVYYCSQAMFQLGDKYWLAYKPQIEQVLLSKQRTDGSWPGDSKGPAYPAAMSVLALSVQYRYLPIYQR